MDGSIVLGRRQRNRLLDLYRKEGVGPAVRLRAHIILLLADARPWSLICAVLFCSTATVARWKRRFEQGGLDALLQEQRGRRPLLAGWASLIVGWVKKHTPRDFGYCRSRWCCATLLLVLFDTQRVKVSAETVRRGTSTEEPATSNQRRVTGSNSRITLCASCSLVKAAQSTVRRAGTSNLFLSAGQLACSVRGPCVRVAACTIRRAFAGLQLSRRARRSFRPA